MCSSNTSIYTSHRSCLAPQNDTLKHNLNRPSYKNGLCIAEREKAHRNKNIRPEVSNGRSKGLAYP